MASGKHARRRVGHRGLITAVLPLVSCLVAVATVAICYLLTNKLTSFSAGGIYFPAISFLGMREEAVMPWGVSPKRVYQLGFSVTGAMLMLVVQLLGSCILKPLSKLPGKTGGASAVAASKRCAVSSALRYSVLAGLGVIAQGVAVLNDGAGGEHWSQNIMHWGGAIAFMMGTHAHAAEVMDMLKDCGTAHPELRTIVRRSLTWKETCLAENVPGYALAGLFLVPVAFQVVLGGAGSMTAPSAAQNAIGLTQWAVVASLMAYYCSYMLDFHKLAPALAAYRPVRPEEARKDRTK